MFRSQSYTLFGVVMATSACLFGSAASAQSETTSPIQSPGESSSSSTANPNAKLLMNINVPMQHYGIPWQISETRVLVKNLAYEKKVTIVFEKDGKTSESEAKFFAPGADGYEVWEAYSNIDASMDSFHVEYKAAGESFTLQNEGQNFPLATGAVLYNGQAIQQLLTGKEFYSNYARITAAVKSDLGPDKSVILHYSFDNFQHESVKDLSFMPYYTYGYGVVNSPSDRGTELWAVSLTELPSDVAEIRYYLTVESKGERFEDRNFGQSYRMKRAKEQ